MYFTTSKLLLYFEANRINGVNRSTVSRLCEITSGPASITCCINSSFPRKSGIRTSIFIETDPELIKNAVETGTDRVELYTEPYAANFSIDKEQAIEPFIKAAETAVKVGLGLNAGHDLSLENLKYFNQNIPGLMEVSIGHALISDALYFGLENTIQMYLRELKL